MTSVAGEQPRCAPAWQQPILTVRKTTGKRLSNIVPERQALCHRESQIPFV